MKTATKSILPGATIAVLGGGHMGRLTTMAAKALGYRVHVLDGDPACTSEGIADRSIIAKLNDPRAIADVVRDCDVVTTSLEQVPATSLASASVFALVRPGPEAIAIAQERERERRWLEDRGVEVGPWRAVDTREDLSAAVTELGGPCYVKPRLRREGDVGPILVTSVAESSAAWVALRGRPAVVEQVLPIDLELSVLVARSPQGEIKSYPPAVSFREHTRLLCSVVPGPLPQQLAHKARELASFLAAKLGIEGLLAVEMFLLEDGRLIVNELVPCAHATFQATEGACATSQFEQLIRAITNMALGDTNVVRPGASVAIPSEMWRAGKPPRFDEALRMHGVRLHLYATRNPSVGRVIGHLSASGNTSDEAIDNALQAAERLVSGPTRREITRRHVAIRRRRARINV